MTAFEIFLYALALVAVLWIRAGAPLPGDTPAPALVVDDLPSLGALLAEAEALTARPVPAVAAAVAAPVAIARVEVPSAVEVSGLETLTIRQLKAMARGKVPGYSKMKSAQLRDALVGV